MARQRMCSGSLVLMGTRRMRSCTPRDTAPSPWGASSQEPFAELVWAGPLWNGHRTEKGIEVTKKWQILKLHVEHILSSALNSHSSSSTPAHAPAPLGSVSDPYLDASSWFLLQGLCMVYHAQVEPKKLPALHLLLE